MNLEDKKQHLIEMIDKLDDELIKITRTNIINQKKDGFDLDTFYFPIRKILQEKRRTNSKFYDDIEGILQLGRELYPNIFIRALLPPPKGGLCLDFYSRPYMELLYYCSCLIE